MKTKIMAAMLALLIPITVGGTDQSYWALVTVFWTDGATLERSNGSVGMVAGQDYGCANGDHVTINLNGCTSGSGHYPTVYVRLFKSWFGATERVSEAHHEMGLGCTSSYGHVHIDVNLPQITWEVDNEYCPCQEP